MRQSRNATASAVIGTTSTSSIKASRSNSNPEPVMHFPFEKLPAELRNKIYAYSLVTGEDEPLRYKYARRNESRQWKRLKNCKRANVGLIGVSKEINAEATKVFYSGNKFLLEMFGYPFTSAVRRDYLYDIKSVEVKLNLARGGSYGQHMEEALTFGLPTFKNLTTISFILQGRNLPHQLRIQDQIRACLGSLTKLTRIDVKGAQYNQRPDDLPNPRDWAFVQLLRCYLSRHWVEWVPQDFTHNPTRVTFKKWEGPMPAYFKDWTPGKGRVDPTWGSKSKVFIGVALLEKVDYSALGQYIDVGRRRGILVRPLLLSGEGGILAVSYLCNPEDGPATGSTNDE